MTFTYSRGVLAYGMAWYGHGTFFLKSPMSPAPALARHPTLSFLQIRTRVNSLGCESTTTTTSTKADRYVTDESKRPIYLSIGDTYLYKKRHGPTPTAETELRRGSVSSGPKRRRRIQSGTGTSSWINQNGSGRIIPVRRRLTSLHRKTIADITYPPLTLTLCVGNEGS